MKTIQLIIFSILLTVVNNSAFSQNIEYDAKFDLTIYTIARGINTELLIKNGNGNTFTGILKIDGEEREVFGWHTEKISEGGMLIYNTKGLVFYVKLKADFQHLQLFKGILNHDETVLSGNYFYWGNEFIFHGKKSEIVDNPVDTIQNPVDSVYNYSNSQITIIIDNNISDLIKFSPNPVNNFITVASTVIELNNLYIELYSEIGVLINRFDLFSNITQLDLSNIPNGNYLIKLFNKEGQVLGTLKIVKC